MFSSSELAFIPLFLNCPILLNKYERLFVVGSMFFSVKICFIIFFLSFSSASRVKLGPIFSFSAFSLIIFRNKECIVPIWAGILFVLFLIFSTISFAALLVKVVIIISVGLKL